MVRSSFKAAIFDFSGGGVIGPERVKRIEKSGGADDRVYLIVPVGQGIGESSGAGVKRTQKDRELMFDAESRRRFGRQ